MPYRLPPLEETRLITPVRALALLAIPMAAIAVLGMRANQLEPLAGFGVLTFACILAASAITLSIVGMVDIWQTGKTGLWRLVRTMALAGLVLALPAYFAIQAFRLPPITDVTTDLENPPLFSGGPAALAARGGHTHPLPDKRAQAAQARAYPALRPLLLDVPADEAYELVRSALTALKWRITQQSPPIPPDRRGEHAQAGYMESTVESPILRLKDDIVIRLTPQGQQTRIDIRSASRFGRHDLGANAARILRLVEEIKAQED